MIEPLLQAERLLLHGLVDQAEALYRRTLEADPRNSIAVVGLARVALERSDDRLAYTHACAALEIDPQNVAALRLEARLSEVLATRGEPVQRPAWLAGGRSAEASSQPSSVSGQPQPVTEPSSPEHVALARNPSMEDHRRRMEQHAADPDQATPTASAAAAPRPPANASPRAPRTTRRRPKGLLRRMLGL